MDDRRRIAFGVTLIVAIFLAVQLAAVALVDPFEAAGHQPVDDPTNPTNSLFYIAAILVLTGVMLLAFRLNVDELIRLLIVGSGVWIALIVFGVLLPPTVAVWGVDALAAVLALAMGVALYAYPEWYVIDGAGVVMGAGAAGLFGITFGIFPALLLLTVLAVYDAISVYGTEHMLTLASGVMDLKVPVVLVIPLTPTYSFLSSEAGFEPSEEDGSSQEAAPNADETIADESDEGADTSPADAADADIESKKPEEVTDEGPLDRDALFIGLGDAVIPTILVASAAFFLPDSLPTTAGIPIPAVTAMVGTFAGLAVLLWLVLKGRAHAGLPLLNGGTILGYFLGALAVGLSVTEAVAIGGF